MQTGATVWIDDGKLKAKVEQVLPEGIELRVTKTGPKGFKLKPDKGLNFPDTVIELSPLTKKDYSDLNFIANHADIVGYSFVQEVADLKLLQKALEEQLSEKAKKIAIIAKIETQKAVHNLPEQPISKDDEVLIKVQSASLNVANWHLLRADPFLVRLMAGGFL